MEIDVTSSSTTTLVEYGARLGRECRKKGGTRLYVGVCGRVKFEGSNNSE